jgi:hypothetical protein
LFANAGYKMHVNVILILTTFNVNSKNVLNFNISSSERKDDSHNTRQKRLDYAAVIKGIPENYLPDRQEVPGIAKLFEI